jgi:hypothetical protein
MIIALKSVFLPLIALKAPAIRVFFNPSLRFAGLSCPWKMPNHDWPWVSSIRKVYNA